MPTFRRICCPVDFSAPSTVALRAAAELAKRLGASLTILHVHQETPVPAPFQPDPGQDPSADERLAEARRLLDVARRDAEAALGAPVPTELLVGDPVHEIELRAADYDLLVMGTHGRTGVRRLVLGSVTDRVLKRAPCPVVVVRTTDGREDDAR
jgi:nucleotide-binding universal stress UspA family protein